MTSTRHPSGAIVYDVPYFVDARGAINVLEIVRDLPFECRRVFYTYSVPEGCVRGEHAHKACEQFLISLSGRIDVLVDDGLGHRDAIVLDTPSRGLWIPRGRWGVQSGHSQDNILLVLASLPYDNEDYIRDYDAFLEWRKLNNGEVS